MGRPAAGRALGPDIDITFHSRSVLLLHGQRGCIFEKPHAAHLRRSGIRLRQSDTAVRAPEDEANVAYEHPRQVFSPNCRSFCGRNSCIRTIYGRYVLLFGAVRCRSRRPVEWVAANALLARWFTDAGLATRTDAVNNLWGRVEGSKGIRKVVSSSHIDSQCPGGRYDGALGILSALVAVRLLIEEFGQPKRPLEVVSLCEEEGGRFPTPQFSGSAEIAPP